MPWYRIKTEEEFEKDYGKNWKILIPSWIIIRSGQRIPILSLLTLSGQFVLRTNAHNVIIHRNFLKKEEDI
jgi:hypothetical protein